MTKMTEDVGIDRCERIVVAIADADAVEHLRDAPGDARADAEIGIGAERGNDFLGVALHLLHRDFARHAGFPAYSSAACSTSGSNTRRSISTWRLVSLNG